QAREILYLRGKLNELYAKHTGKTADQIEKDMDRDRFMSSDEAKEYGLIYHVIANLLDMDGVKKKLRLASVVPPSQTRESFPTIRTSAASSAGSPRTGS